MLILTVVLVLLVVLAGCGFVVASAWKRRSYPSCGKCQYDVTATIGHSVRCPECGADFAEVGVRPPERFRPALCIAGVALVLVGGCLGAGALSSMIAMREAAIARQQAWRAVAAQQQAQAAQRQAESVAATEAEPGEPDAPDERDSDQE